MSFTYLLIIVIVLLFIVYDFIPTILPRIKRRSKQKNIYYKEIIIDKIIDASFKMTSENYISQFWTKEKSFTISKALIDFLLNRKKNTSKHFKIYNYPKAFLIYGLAVYLKENESERLIDLKKKFDNLYIDENGMPSFKIDKVDQSPFATTALILYEIYKEDKYKVFADNMFKYIMSLEDKETGIIKYREKLNIYFNDTLGMIIPFLIKYYELTKDPKILDICIKQIEFYNKYGIDFNTNIPVHGIHMDYNNLKVGSANWGRGIGWYFYGLVSLNKVTNTYSEEILKLEKTLNELKNNEDLWTQFPGTTTKFDASTTTMILASLAMYNKKQFDANVILQMISKYIDKDGYILETSGDTIGLNFYSRDFGTSELSQGFLLLTLAYLEN